MKMPKDNFPLNSLIIFTSLGREWESKFENVSFKSQDNYGENYLKWWTEKNNDYKSSFF